MKQLGRNPATLPKAVVRSKGLRVSRKKTLSKSQEERESIGDQLWSDEQEQEWFESMPYLEGNAVSYQPAAGSMDPFHTAPISITTREEALFQYYCTFQTLPDERDLKLI